MKLTHNISEIKGSFSLHDGDKEVGRGSYFYDTEKRIIIDHIWVDPTYRGQSVGKRLVHEIVGFARDQDLEVIPWCSYAKTIMDRSK